MELSHCRPDRTSQREITVQKWKMEYECIFTDWKLEFSQCSLIFTSPPSGFQRIFVGFCCLWGFFQSENRYPLMTNLLFLSCPRNTPPLVPICKKRSRDKSSQASISSLSTFTLYIRGMGKQYKTEGETSDVWGSFVVDWGDLLNGVTHLGLAHGTSSWCTAF